jgi:hypothetical protein
MEAIFARAIELTYVRPNPALDAYAWSRGKEIRMVAGVDGHNSVLALGTLSSSAPGGRNRPRARLGISLSQQSGHRWSLRFRC